MSRRLNLGEGSPLMSIPEANAVDYDSDSLASEDLGLAIRRHHSIQDIVAAKIASKIFKQKVMQARKNYIHPDAGKVEVIHADYPLIRDDLVLSRGRSTVGGSIRSGSATIEDNLMRSMKYNMEPLRRFKEREVKHIIKCVFEEHVNNKEYDSEMCRYKSRVIADVIKERVKKLFLPRYKFICLVHMGQIGQQTMRLASRCSWDTNVDDFAEYAFKNKTLWAVGLVYGIYCE